MANNEPIYNAVICGAGGSTQERWITSTDSGDYDPSIIELIAEAVDADIPTDTIGASQQALMQSICQGVFAGRFPTADNYTAIAAAIVAAYTALAQSLFPDVSPGGTFDPIYQQLWVDTTKPADGNGSIGTPYDTFGGAMSAIQFSSPENFDAWSVFLAQNIDATGAPIPNMGAGAHDDAKVKIQGVLNSSPYLSEPLLLQNLAVEPQGNGRITLDFENIYVQGLSLDSTSLFLIGNNASFQGVTASGTITGGSNLVNCSISGIGLSEWDLRMQGGYIEPYFQDTMINDGVLDSVEFIVGAVLRSSGTLVLTNCRFQSGVQLITDNPLQVDLATWGNMKAASVTCSSQLVITPWMPVLSVKESESSTNVNPNSTQNIDLGVLTPEAERSLPCVAVFGVEMNSNLTLIASYIDANRHLNIVVRNGAGTTQSLDNPTLAVTYLPQVTP